MTTELCDLLKVRESLGKSQSEFADLLGVSVRAVQSYEQGWRATPPLVQKMAILLLFLKFQQTNKAQPCYKIKGCSAEKRQKCTADQMCDGQMCWIVTGNSHDGKKLKNWDAKAAKCRKCEILKQWMPA